MAILQDMDEILIADKKYVSSKRAAKITGYAKDYIGQLCREGRVPARLVGRSWYVLESAIQDHRFGAKDEPVEAKQAPERLTDAWDTPRYEAAEPQVLPTVNRLRNAEDEAQAENAPSDSAAHLESAWQAWFDRVADAAHITTEAAQEPAMAVEESGEAAEEQAAEEEGEDIAVPIRAIYMPPLRKPVRDEVRQEEGAIAELGEGDIEANEAPRSRLRARKAGAVIRVTSVALAMVSLVIAIIGTGYADKYIITNSQARIIAGVSLYNK